MCKTKCENKLTVADTKIDTSIVINLRDCMHSNPQAVILENAPNVCISRNISIYPELLHW